MASRLASCHRLRPSRTSTSCRRTRDDYPPRRRPSTPRLPPHASPRSPSIPTWVTVRCGRVSGLTCTIHSSPAPRHLADLVRTFFDMFQPQCPLVDTTLFLQAWENAGRVTENLSPANECLALVIQAWAARLTDHPAAIGSGAPTLQDLRNGAGRDFTAVGNRREEFARAAMERAMAAVDRRGALRMSSASCCAALTLLEFLITCAPARPLLLPSTRTLNVDRPQSASQGATHSGPTRRGGTSSRRRASTCATCSSTSAMTQLSGRCGLSRRRTGRSCGCSTRATRCPPCLAGASAPCLSLPSPLQLSTSP